MAPLQRNDEALEQGLVPNLNDPDRPGNGSQNKVRIAQGSEVNEHGSVFKMRNDVVRDRQCHAGLTDAAGTGQGQEWNGLVQDECPGRDNLRLPTNESGAWNR